MSSAGTNLQGFPKNSAPVVAPERNYTWTTEWLRFMMSLWIRSGTAQGGTGAPTGSIQAFAGPTTAIPVGWLLCDGSAVSRVDYGALYGVISTYWGSGDGTTTFNIPSLANRFLVGTGTLALGSRGGSIPLTGGSGNGYAAVNWIIKI
jgi:microcystin-dependent protein